LAAFEVLEEEPQLIEQLWANTQFFKDGLKKLGFNTGLSETPITPVIVGDAALAHEFSRQLFATGVFAQGIGFPTVPQGKARIRTIVTATHTQEELTKALGILADVGKKLKIIE
jgi:glycine C-acetyltransferase